MHTSVYTAQRQVFLTKNLLLIDTPDIRVRSENVHPCIGFVSSFFHKLDNLKEDRLLEKGKHAELLEKTGYYTKLWNAQIEA